MIDLSPALQEAITALRRCFISQAATADIFGKPGFPAVVDVYGASVKGGSPLSRAEITQRIPKVVDRATAKELESRGIVKITSMHFKFKDKTGDTIHVLGEEIKREHFFDSPLHQLAWEAE